MTHHNNTPSSKKVAFVTVGCKVNQAETDMLRSLFTQAGWLVVGFETAADITVINTCTVTHAADADGRALIRKAHAASPKGKLVVIGCYAQVNASLLSQMDGVDLVLGSQNKMQIMNYLDAVFDPHSPKPIIDIATTPNSTVTQPPQNNTLTLQTPAPQRTRASLKVQDGCNFFCSYCIVPHARGNPVSRPHQQILAEAAQLAALGFAEIVITGINIGLYQDGPHYTLAQLIKDLDQVAGMRRLRLSSIEPNTLASELITVLAQTTHVCPHLHIPLQSGSDHMLKAMNRRYTISEYQKIIHQLTNTIPNLGLTTDVIVGFPGESDKDFDLTKQHLDSMPFSGMHIFKYSPRHGTPAAALPEHIHPLVAKQRAQVLQQIKHNKMMQFATAHIGHIRPVLFDQVQNNQLSGYTDNYIRVQVVCAHTDKGSEVKTKLIKVSDDGLMTGVVWNPADQNKSQGLIS